MLRKRTGSVHTITGAPKSLKDDVLSREKRYLISMGIRTVCFLLAIFVTEGLLRWLLIVAAIGLPYVAVVLANAGRERRGNAPATYTPPPGPELSSGPHDAIDNGPKNSSKDLPAAPLQ